MKIETLIAAIVTQELFGKKEALHFHFDLDLCHYCKGGKYFSQRRGLHLLYHMERGSSYVSVFSAVTNSPLTKISDIKEWKHETTHDSDWRDIGVFSDTYFEMAEKINASLKEAGFEEVAPKDMTEHNNIPIFAPMYEWVDVRVRKDPDDKYNYRKLIEVK